MNNFFKHIKIIRTHRKYVRKACFKMGLVWQGLTHDLSKYSPTEMKVCKYYTGRKSPHQIAREQLGYSPFWIHHYHTNKHHHMFWIDETETGEIIPMKMPFKFVCESLADMLGASKAYNLENWRPELLLSYWEQKCLGKRIMHEDSIQLLDTLIRYLVNHGEENFFIWYKENKDALKNNYST